MTNRPYRPESAATRAKRVASAKLRHAAERAAKLRHARCARKRCNEAVIALKLASGIFEIDLMTGNWSDSTAEILPFPGNRRRAS
jgi:hypothetical protein